MFYLNILSIQADILQLDVTWLYDDFRGGSEHSRDKENPSISALTDALIEAPRCLENDSDSDKNKINNDVDDEVNVTATNRAEGVGLSFHQLKTMKLANLTKK